MTTQVGRQFATDIENHGLKYLTVGGEKLVTLDPPKNYSLANAYGPTECTILITAFKVEKSESTIPIGKPIDNVKLYVVDANGHRVPVGACGELLAASTRTLTKPATWFAGGKFIAAYVVGAEKKPPYMVPAVTMQIDKNPRRVPPIFWRISAIKLTTQLFKRF